MTLKDISIRYGISTLGLIFVALGVGISIKSNLGIAPPSCPPTILNLRWILLIFNGLSLTFGKLALKIIFYALFFTTHRQAQIRRNLLIINAQKNPRQNPLRIVLGTVSLFRLNRTPDTRVFKPV